jgi:hypothetical protein
VTSRKFWWLKKSKICQISGEISKISDFWIQ